MAVGWHVSVDSHMTVSTPRLSARMVQSCKCECVTPAQLEKRFAFPVLNTAAHQAFSVHCGGVRKRWQARFRLTVKIVLWLVCISLCVACKASGLRDLGGIEAYKA